MQKCFTSLFFFFLYTKQNKTMALSHSPPFSRSSFSISTSTKTQNPTLSPSSFRTTPAPPLPIHVPRVVPFLSDGFVGSLKPTPSPKPYVRKDTCLVVPPPRGRKPLAVVKFLGGAFVGAVPEVTYGHLMELLAREGYLVISVPYNVTFNHEMAARQVYERFHACFDGLLESGLPDASISPLEISGLPLYSVGHSNGALLQLLVGSYFDEKLPQANAIVSFNNKPATEAVPYFEQLGPFMSQVLPVVESIPVYSMATSASESTLKALMDTAGSVIQEIDKEAFLSLTKFADQLPSVFNQVREGTSEFKPTPPENREFFKKSYFVPRTLLVKFSTDAIDESDTIEEVLRPRVESFGGKIEKITLSGNHLTPCFQDLKWPVGPLYTPADALAQSLKSLSLNETRVLSRTITDWFKSLDIDS
ncbi:initiation factor 4F subunit (DUF1350) [Rhynchospora pubera]|uniref:Initiation factor 4F subunit (DUF1350) n=1 Tax=Rhynchospora pubera TaxID=906938 RepID=A0AAV8GEM1_9POAL|nr:initiation factor 4F subunit (DUF1350) [Rhynchospora pubera]